MKQFLQVAKGLVFPPRCAGCHALLLPTARGEGAVFCEECAKEWRAELCHSCPTCFAAYPECHCQPGVMKKAGSAALLKLVPYGDTPHERVARHIVLDMKKHPRRRTLALLARELAPALDNELNGLGWERTRTVLAHLPRDRRSVRRYGADQAESLARALTSETGIAHLPLLYRKKRAKTQKKLSAKERAENLRDVFEVRKLSDVSCVILVDDVVTTGASMSAGVHALREKGVKNILCVSVAQTPKKH